MRTKNLWIVFVVFLLNISMASEVEAQIRIRIPSLPKAAPSPAATPSPAPTSKSEGVVRPTGTVDQSPTEAKQTTPDQPRTPVGQMELPAYMTKPVGTDKPFVLRETFSIRADTNQRFWKLPNESNYTSWVPQISFRIRYESNMRTRLVAEYFNPDGSSWYSEPLADQQFDSSMKSVEIYSRRDDAKFAKASNMGGVYGIKITDTRDGSVLFEGKFKVTKIKAGNAIPMFKNTYEFVVDNEGVLPVGFIHLDYKRDNLTPMLILGFWTKGEFRGDSLEGRLYRNGQQILTTDEMGEIMTPSTRFPNDVEVRKTNTFEYKEVAWYGFRYAAHESSRRSYPNATFINDSDGDYVFKLFYNGTQIREAAFVVKGGIIVDTGYGKAGGLSPFKNVIQMTVMGDVETLNPGTLEGNFYSNPVPGIGIVVKGIKRDKTK